MFKTFQNLSDYATQARLRKLNGFGIHVAWEESSKPVLKIQGQLSRILCCEVVASDVLGSTRPSWRPGFH